jgi:NAD(P) transhydrogenase subunit alpha
VATDAWSADAVLKVAPPEPSETPGEGKLLIGFLSPLTNLELVKRLAEARVTSFGMESIPRTTRAQSMDALSSQAVVAGYRAALAGAQELGKFLPMLTTAAGTVRPSRVLVLGAGVAGLQAIATARRLGAVVSAFDVRPAVKEQVESLGAKFLELPLEVQGAEDKGGYARAQDEAFYRRQRELLSKAVAGSDVVITTAAVPGRKAPVLVTGEMVAAMTAGSVIVDLAAERGGNCELTAADRDIVTDQGVLILGPTNLASAAPYHSSQMYSRNLVNFLQVVAKGGQLQLDAEDDIVRETLVARGGEVVHPRVLEALGLTPAAAGVASS